MFVVVFLSAMYFEAFGGVPHPQDLGQIRSVDTGFDLQ